MVLIISRQVQNRCHIQRLFLRIEFRVRVSNALSLAFPNRIFLHKLHSHLFYCAPYVHDTSGWTIGKRFRHKNYTDSLYRAYSNVISTMHKW